MQRACQIEIPQKTQVQLVNYKMFLSKQTNLNYYKLLVSKRLIAMLSLFCLSQIYICTILCRKPLSLTLSLSLCLTLTLSLCCVARAKNLVACQVQYIAYCVWVCLSKPVSVCECVCVCILNLQYIYRVYVRGIVRPTTIV